MRRAGSAAGRFGKIEVGIQLIEGLDPGSQASGSEEGDIGFQFIQELALTAGDVFESGQRPPPGRENSIPASRLARTVASTSSWLTGISRRRWSRTERVVEVNR